jgi:predicted N-acetyltransferase YhbS
MKISEITIRTEEEKDYQEVITLNEEAFRFNNFTDGKEGDLVRQLRISKVFIPELSIVAEYMNSIVGHILISKVYLEGINSREILSLTPMCVKPVFHNKGIGTLLIEEGLKRARELGFDSIIVIGHPSYYPRFGFKLASAFNLKLTFECPDEAFMAQELTPGSLKDTGGVIKLPPEFDKFIK